MIRYTKGFPKAEWIKTRSRNEALNCRVRAHAALCLLNPLWRRIWRRGCRFRSRRLLSHRQRLRGIRWGWQARSVGNSCAGLRLEILGLSGGARSIRSKQSLWGSDWRSGLPVCPRVRPPVRGIQTGVCRGGGSRLRTAINSKWSSMRMSAAREQHT